MSSSVSGPLSTTTSRLNSDARQWLRSFLAPSSLFSLYLECAFDAWDQERLDNREFLIGRRKQGVILLIRFDGISVFTVVGDLDPDEVAWMAQVRTQAEFHIGETLAKDFFPLIRDRLVATETLRYYQLKNPERLCPELKTDPRCRILGPDDFENVHRLFSTHYRTAIFSKWMLEKTFVGLFENGELIATGGTIIENRRSGACNIGNFLTVPAHRGRGLAKTVAQDLVCRLQGNGMTTFTLGAAESNIAAWKAYEAIGFRIENSRLEIRVRGV